MAKDALLKLGPCPFVEQGDGRCSCRMTKQTLAQAFEFCLGGRHFSCQTYHAIKWERQAQADDSTTQLQPGTPTPIRHQPGGKPRQPASPAARLGNDDQQAVA